MRRNSNQQPSCLQPARFEKISAAHALPNPRSHPSPLPPSPLPQPGNQWETHTQIQPGCGGRSGQAVVTCRRYKQICHLAGKPCSHLYVLCSSACSRSARLENTDTGSNFVEHLKQQVGIERRRPAESWKSINVFSSPIALTFRTCKKKETPDGWGLSLNTNLQ